MNKVHIILQGVFIKSFHTQTQVKDIEKYQSQIFHTSIENLINLSLQTLILNLFVLTLIFLGLNQYLDNPSIYTWYIFGEGIIVLRILHTLKWRQNLLNNLNLNIKLYTLGAFLSGLIWASIVLFYTMELPLTLQVFIIITLVGMPTASLSTNGNYFPVYLAFSLPQLFALVYWSLFVVHELNLYFLLIAFSYSYLVISTAYKLQSYLQQGIASNLMNIDLVKDVHEINTELTQFAYLDVLTEIPNRRYFIENTTKKLKIIKAQANKHLTFMLLDLDKFKETNDTLGHQAGDKYLIEIAKRLQKFSEDKSNALVARLGGDEFIICYELDNKKQATQDAKTLIELIKQPIHIKEDVITPGTSIGIASYPDQGNNIGTLLGRADKAMYRAKSNGGNTFFYCQEVTENKVFTKIVAS